MINEGIAAAPGVGDGKESRSVTKNRGDHKRNPVVVLDSVHRNTLTTWRHRDVIPPFSILSESKRVISDTSR